MERIEKTIEVEAPLRAVYNQWTQFEEFPRFMSGVKEVRQLDPTHVHWHAEIWGVDKEWDAEITEQQPDTRISWKSVDGDWSAGTVRFADAGPGRTRVRLVMAYEPEGAVEKAGETLGILDQHVERTLEQFKQFIERRGNETGGWRGTVVDSSTGPAGAMLSLHFDDPSTGRTTTLGPSAWFRISGNYIRQAPDGKIVAIFRRHQWSVHSHEFTRFSGDGPVAVHFEDPEGGATEIYGPFGRFTVTDGVMHADDRLFAKFIEETQLWHCFPTENFWAAIVFEAAPRGASASPRRSPG